LSAALYPLVLPEYHGLWRSWLLVYTHLAVMGEQNVGLRAPAQCIVTAHEKSWSNSLSAASLSA
jgi:hypothetical protein